MAKRSKKLVVALEERGFSVANKRAALAAAGYIALLARVDLIGFEPPNGGTYVAVRFVNPPSGVPLSVSTQWDARGVDLAQFAMSHNKRLLIVYKPPKFKWSNIVDLAVIG